MKYIPRFFYDAKTEPRVFLRLRLLMLKILVLELVGLPLLFGWWGLSPTASVILVLVTLVFTFFTEVLIEMGIENERGIGGGVVVIDDGDE